MALSTRFGRNSATAVMNRPLTDDEIMRVAPSIFAAGKHESRSERYTHVPTVDVLNGLRSNGFEAFSVTQSRSRIEGKSEYTKHMLRLRHATQISGPEANEIILLNSHDGTSSYQMLAGRFRFVCSNGMVCGETDHDIRVSHRGNIIDNVIEGAYTVLDTFEYVNDERDEMASISLSQGEQRVFADAALELKWDEEHPAPIAARQLLTTRRLEDAPVDLWTTLNVVQENVIRGGLSGRTTRGQRTRTRAVTGIDSNVKLNRAMWKLAEGMRALKAT